MSAAKQHTFAIVGCGKFTQSALPPMLSSARWQLVGLMDPIPENLGATRQLTSLPPHATFADEDSLYRALRPDVVFVHSPVLHHAANCRRAIEAGCNVCCQKPFVANLAEGAELARQARAAGRWISVGQNVRLSSTMKRIAQAIADGTIGLPRFGHRTLYRNRMRFATGYKLAEPWPVINACGIHAFDVFRMWFGGTRIARVQFRGIDVPWNPYSYPGVVTGWIEMESGFVMTYLESHVSHVSLDLSRHPYEDGMIQGRDGAIRWSGPWGHGPVELLRGDREKGEVIHPGGDDWPQPMVDLMDLLADAVEGNAPVFCPAEDNLWSIAAVAAAQLSAEKGGQVVDVIDMAERAGLDSHSKVSA